MKRCSKCGIDKDDSAFTRWRICKACKCAYQRAYKAALIARYGRPIVEGQRAVDYAANRNGQRDHIINYQKEHRAANREAINARRRAAREAMSPEARAEHLARKREGERARFAAMSPQKKAERAAKVREQERARYALHPRRRAAKKGAA